VEKIENELQFSSYQTSESSLSVVWWFAVY
jgi:hypothetical protein